MWFDMAAIMAMPPRYGTVSDGIVMYHNGIVFGIIITGIDEMVRYGEMMYGIVWYQYDMVLCGMVYWYDLV